MCFNVASRRSLQFMGFGMEYAPFIILYGIALQWCWNTSGEPYAAAIAHEAAKKAAKCVVWMFAPVS